MIPGQVSEKPGKDTMGMDMVPVYEDTTATGAAITIDAGTIQKMNLKTDLVTRGPVRRQIRTVGVVEFDERTRRDVTTKYEGWIEKLYVDATWTTVKAGDPLFEIYSPELYNAELNYLLALRAEGSASGPLSRPALEKLKLFDVAPAFLAEIARTGEAPRTYTFTAPADGVVIEKMAVVGQMMKPGELIYRLADLSTVWLNAQIYEEDLAAVAPGRPVEVSATHGSQRGKGTIEQILPQVQAETRTAVARIVLDNADGTWRPGMFADVRLTAELAPSAVLVPDSAVLRSGERNTVFVALPGGEFAPREVKLGAHTEDYRYEVLSGLAEGERVVVSGQFMLDSESQLREAIQKMLK
jgi:multidrug efflux pump subunit AcrA (membrane-fusion protein)